MVYVPPFMIIGQLGSSFNPFLKRDWSVSGGLFLRLSLTLAC